MVYRSPGRQNTREHGKKDYSAHGWWSSFRALIERRRSSGMLIPYAYTHTHTHTHTHTLANTLSHREAIQEDAEGHLQTGLDEEAYKAKRRK